jgi:S1-C subfamily serine protease
VAGTDDIAWNAVLPNAGFLLERQADGYLGVSFLPDVPDDEFDDRDDADRPAIVQRVEAGFPAALMDLRPGDRLLSIDGREVSYGLAGALVRSLPTGVPVKVRVVRHGRTLELSGEPATQYSHHTLRLAPESEQTEGVRSVVRDLFASHASTRDDVDK